MGFAKRIIGPILGMVLGTAGCAHDASPAPLPATRPAMAATTVSSDAPPIPIRTLIGHTISVMSVAFSPDGKTALSGGADEAIRLWDLSTGLQIWATRSRDVRYNGMVPAVAISPDGRTALSGDAGEIKSWDMATGKMIRSFAGLKSWAFSLAFCPDGHFALSAGQDPGIRLWNVDTGELVRTLNFSERGVILDRVAVSPNGRLVVGAGHGLNDARTISVFDLSTGQEIRTFDTSGQGNTQVEFSPDGQTILSTASDYGMKIWDVATGKVIRTFDAHGEQPDGAIFSPDGRTILSGNLDGLVVLWDLTSGEEIQVFKGQSEPITCLAISPDGKRAISGSDDATLKLWDLTPYLPKSASPSTTRNSR